MLRQIISILKTAADGELTQDSWPTLFHLKGLDMFPTRYVTLAGNDIYTHKHIKFILFEKMKRLPSQIEAMSMCLYV